MVSVAPPRKQSRAGSRAGKNTGRRGVGGGLVNDEVIDVDNMLEDFEEPEQLQDIKPEDLPQGSDSLLYEYLQRNDLVDNEYFISLYKYDRDHGEMKTFCEKFIGEIPNEDSIGKIYGGGRYCLILQVRDKTGKARGTTRKFKLHKRYDRFANSSGQEQGVFPMISLGGSQGNGGNQLQDAVNLVRVMMGTFMPMLKMLQGPQQLAPQENPQSETMASMMTENYKAMNEAMKEMMLDNTQLFNDVSRRAVDLPEVTEDENETSGVVGMFNSLLPFVEKLLPMVTQRGAQGMQAVKTIQEMPGFKNAVKDKATIKKLYDFIEAKHGTGTAKQILQKFKLKSPYKKPTGRPPINEKGVPAK